MGKDESPVNQASRDLRCMEVIEVCYVKTIKHSLFFGRQFQMMLV